MQPETIKDRRGRTIDRILKAATKEFSGAGFAGARVDEIARSAGVNKATIYYHIGGKQALYAQVVHHLSARAVEQLNRNLTAVKSPEDRMRRFIQTLAGMIDQHPEFAAILLREQASGGRHFPELLAQDFAQVLGLLNEILDDGVKAGVFKRTLPLIVHLMIVGTNGFFKMSSPIRARFAPLVAPFQSLNGSHRKNRILVSDSAFATQEERLRRDRRGGAEFKIAGPPEADRDLKRGSNKDMGPKDIFEMASNNVSGEVASEIEKLILNAVKA